MSGSEDWVFNVMMKHARISAAAAEIAARIDALEHGHKVRWTPELKARVARENMTRTLKDISKDLGVTPARLGQVMRSHSRQVARLRYCLRGLLAQGKTLDEIVAMNDADLLRQPDFNRNTLREFRRQYGPSDWVEKK
jgi:hypothetical protein